MGRFRLIATEPCSQDYGVPDWYGNTIAQKKDLQASGILDQLSKEALTKG